MLVGIETPGFAPDVVRVLLQALLQLQVNYLRRYPDTPPLLRSGVRYREEKTGKEKLKTIPFTLRDGYGDCEDLATWFCAERLASGRPCKLLLRWRFDRKNNAYWYHVLVQTADGRRLDPSKMLGMK